MAEFIWDGSASTNGTTAANWTGGAAPPNDGTASLKFNNSSDSGNNIDLNSLNGYSDGFHDVLILGNSVTFEPGEATALFDLPIVAGSHAESDEWVDVTVRPEYPDLYKAVPDSALRLTIVDA